MQKTARTIQPMIVALCSPVGAVFRDTVGRRTAKNLRADLFILKEAIGEPCLIDSMP
jgi:hypothetical protein